MQGFTIRFNVLNLTFCYTLDNRFEDDIHWKGGCVLGGGMLSWAATMFCWDARPPQPQYNSNWKEVWKNRLEMAGECLAKTWLDHQTYDDYWKHGSIGSMGLLKKIQARLLSLCWLLVSKCIDNDWSSLYLLSRWLARWLYQLCTQDGPDSAQLPGYSWAMVSQLA